jgi:putative methionine-R-sulfoxide reductase with GAF domain
MGIQDVLQEFADSWNQEGVCVWFKKGDRFTLAGEWYKGSDPFIALKQHGGLDSFMSFNQDQLSIFSHGDWMIAFYGKAAVSKDEIGRMFPFLAPWFCLLKQAANQERQAESFHSLVRVAHTIVSSLHSDRILDLILETAIQTIPTADTGFLFLYDDKIDKLRVRSAVGFKHESYQLTRLAPGEGVSGQVFVSGKPALIAGREDIASAMKNMTEANFKYYIDSTIYDTFPVSMISVPLIYQDKPIGVLTIDNFMNDASFTREDLQLLQAFADLSAVVIEYSNLFQQVKLQNKELSITHQALSKEHESLQKTFDFHNQLTNIAAKGYGMEEILEVLYQAAKVPVAVYNRLLVPISSYPKTAELKLPEQFLMYPAMKIVNKTRKWQRVDLKEDGQTILVIPIIGTDRIWGICVPGLVRNGLLKSAN